jgi:hypothetical protein
MSNFVKCGNTSLDDTMAMASQGTDISGIVKKQFQVYRYVILFKEKKKIK